MALEWLQGWFAQQCDDDWEHENKIVITSTDNPGWMLTIDLSDTELENVLVPYILVERSEGSWVGYEIAAKQFRGGCSVQNLGALIEQFRSIVLTK